MVLLFRHSRRSGRGLFMSGLLRVELMFLLLVLAVIAMVGFHFAMDGQEDRVKGLATHEDDFALPDASLQIQGVLGQERRTVRSALGAAETHQPDTDSFNMGAHVDVHYADDHADSLVVQWPRAALHERAMRRWLSLPGDGPIEVNGHRYRLTLFVGDDNRVAIEPELNDPARKATPKHHYSGNEALISGEAPPPPSVARATGLLKDFPHMPEGLLASCEERGERHHSSMECPGFDARVAYEMGPGEQPRSLTLIDAPARTEDECRALLEQAQPGLKAGKQVNTQYDHTYFYSSPDLLAAFTWSPVIGFHKTANCSIVACMPGSGHSNCAP